jgi:molecular chaperone DnaK (HSP70)
MSTGGNKRMNRNDSVIIGIDLGTTYSEVAVFIDDKVQVIGPGETKMLPSCVGLSPTGEILIGASARNQELLYPERTVRSIKRKMGSDEIVTIDNKKFRPQEISALILRELAEWAHRKLGMPVKKAVITVPAYFSDAQRNATREAGQLAGLDVIRILNEPTAASLAYGYGSDERRTVMIYDLGGGTFDVSIVTMEKEITEVLASHGNNHLGGDDFDELMADRLLREFRDKHDVDLNEGHESARSRVWRAAEEAKKRLSFDPFVKVREETLVTIDGKPLHLDCEISREEHEEMIRPLVESTLDSVSKAMDDAGKKPGDLDSILLVGGSTRIPLVSRILEDRAGMKARQDVHPDLCVALGAGVLASRLAGRGVDRVLVDVSPFSFGPRYLGERDGVEYPYCYHPIIYSNTPLPVTRTEKYYTSFPRQTEVEMDIYQGDDPDALKNIQVGRFLIKGLRPTEKPNTVLCRMNLDLDGILKVTAVEKDTGKSKQVTIDNALQPRSKEEIAALQKDLQEMYASRISEVDSLFDGLDEHETGDDRDEPDLSRIEVGAQEKEAQAGPYEDTDKQTDETALDDLAWTRVKRDALALLERSRALLDSIHDEDKEEAIDLHEEIESAIASRDTEAIAKASETLKELLFFVE